MSPGAAAVQGGLLGLFGTMAGAIVGAVVGSALAGGEGEEAANGATVGAIGGAVLTATIIGAAYPHHVAAASAPPALPGA